jgi:peptidoglycan hydrolase-like protein with peptidoglycan-binding domain
VAIIIETREDWGALPPKGNPGPFQAYDATVCHYTGARLGYPRANHADCRAQVRSIQVQHQAIPNQTDIEYTMLVCNHGVLMVGRVPGYKTGANGTAASNATMPSICCLLGIGDEPTEAMKEAIRWWHKDIETNYAERIIPMLGHKDVTSTGCPDDILYEWVKAEGYRFPDAPVYKPSPPVAPTPCRYGDRGDNVLALQRQCEFWWHADLVRWGAGIYGHRTEAAVKVLQQEVGAYVDGWYGPKTAASFQAWLMSIYNFVNGG